MKRLRLLRVVASIALAVSFLGLTSASAAPKAPRAVAAPRGRELPNVPKATGLWTSVAAPSGAPTRPLFSVATSASNDAWAVGGAISATLAMGSYSQVYHWNGVGWSAIADTTYLTLASVSLIPGVADKAIAVGASEGGPTSPGLVETCTLSGCGRDTRVPAGVQAGGGVTNSTAILDAVSAVSETVPTLEGTDYWVVGGGGGECAGLTCYPEFGVILHHTASLTQPWTSVLLTQTFAVSSTIPATATLPSVHYRALQMLGDGEGYAVGEGTSVAGPGTIIHYNPVTGLWQRVDLQKGGSLRLRRRP